VTGVSTRGALPRLRGRRGRHPEEPLKRGINYILGRRPRQGPAITLFPCSPRPRKRGSAARGAVRLFATREADTRHFVPDPIFRQMKILDHRAASVGVDQVIITVAGSDHGWIGDTDIGAIS